MSHSMTRYWPWQDLFVAGFSLFAGGYRAHESTPDMIIGLVIGIMILVGIGYDLKKKSD